MKPLLIRIALLLSLACFGQFHDASSAPLDCGQTEQALHVRGLLTQTFYPWIVEGVPQITQTDFELWFTGKRWRIWMKDRGKANRYIEQGTDGSANWLVATLDTNEAVSVDIGNLLSMKKRGQTNTSRSRDAQANGRSRDSLATSRTNSPVWPNEYTATGVIRDGDIPAWGEEIWKAWLPYVSGCHLREVQDTNLPAFFSRNFSDANLTLPAIWRQEAQFPHSLQSLIFVNPGIGKIDLGGKEPFVFRTGSSYTNFTLFTRSVTNVGEWRIPLSFGMDFHWSVSMGPTVTNRAAKKTLSIEGLTLEAELVDPNMDFRPAVPDRTRFSDQRGGVPDMSGPNTVISGGWPHNGLPANLRTDISPARLPAVAETPKPAEPPKANNAVAIVLAVVVFCALAVLAVGTWRRDKTHLNSSSSRK